MLVVVGGKRKERVKETRGKRRERMRYLRICLHTGGSSHRVSLGTEVTRRAQA